MPIAYHEAEPNTAHWDQVWAGQTLEHLLNVAERDRLTRLIIEHLPKHGQSLEGGCGLGQYVRYLNSRGYALVGGDWSVNALQSHRREYSASPLVALDLTRLPFSDAAFSGYISLGVIEHLEQGADALLSEMGRILAPGGVLLLSTPWVNGARRLLGGRIRRRQASRRDAGLHFYQYAYTTRELIAIVERAGFAVQGVHPYSPGKGLREALSLLGGRGDASSTASQTETSAMTAVSKPPMPASRLRGLLYVPVVLHMLAHMALVVAVKP